MLKFMAAAAIRGSRTGLFQARIRIVVQAIAASILPKVAFSKDAFPNRRLTPSDRPSQTPAKFGRMSRRGFCPLNSNRNDQAFVRSAAVSCAALSAIALSQTCLWNLYSDGLSYEITGHPPIPSGRTNPVPMLCPEGSRSRGIFQAVFFDPRRLYRGFFCPITARLMPPRSVLGGPGKVRPAAVISPATVSL